MLPFTGILYDSYPPPPAGPQGLSRQRPLLRNANSQSSPSRSMAVNPPLSKPSNPFKLKSKEIVSVSGSNRYKERSRSRKQTAVPIPREKTMPLRMGMNRDSCATQSPFIVRFTS